MAELTDAEIDAVLERGRSADLHEPRAASTATSAGWWSS